MKRPNAAQTDISAQLSTLNQPSKQNKHLPKLPPNTTISRRPINHAPISSPFAGSKAQKVVYISRKTPIMSAVKRVKKFLNEIEKRAMQSAGVDGVLERRNARGGADEALQRKLAEVSEGLARDAEEVLVRASGRAMGQALRVGEWFRGREEEMLVRVEVRGGSVSVVDDIVEREGVEDEGNDGDDGEAEYKENEEGVDVTRLEGGDTTMELLKNLDKDGQDGRDGGSSAAEQPGSSNGGSGVRKPAMDEKGTDVSEQSKKKRKRKRREYDPDDLPEARLRWVKTIEVAISLRA